MEINIINGYPKYSISEDGIVKNTHTGRVLKNYNDDGYLRVDVREGGVRRSVRVHRLVAESFIPNPENKPQVNHINGIKTDNRVENLEWATSQENLDHARSLGLLNPDGFTRDMREKAWAVCRKRVINKETNIIYESINDAAKAVGFSQSYVSSMLSGVQDNKTQLELLIE